MEGASSVCVTGANGFIAAYVVQQLLAKGYAVHGTVRDAADHSKTAHLTALGNADNLALFSASLTGDGVKEAFKAAIEGCDTVIHTASPYSLNVSDPQRDLVDPAVQGVENVLHACKEMGVRKVVLTSSVAAITDSPDNDVEYTEEHWNEASSLTRNPYYFSKTLAERRAWELAGELGLSLVVINPFAVIGPTLSPSVNPSNSLFVSILTAEWPGILDISWGFVDVRDVAAAHVLALESDNAEGRYIVWNVTKSMREVCELLRPRYANYPIPTKDLSHGVAKTLVYYSSYLQPSGTGQYLRTNLGCHPRLNNTKIQELGLEFTPVETSIFDACDDLIAKGAVPRLPEFVAREQWVPDSAHESCMHCEKKFSVTNRRHHCRACGHLLCDKCAPVVLSNHRICSRCQEGSEKE